MRFVNEAETLSDLRIPTKINGICLVLHCAVIVTARSYSLIQLIKFYSTDQEN